MARTKMSVLTVVLLLLCSAVASWAATVAAPAFSKPHGFYDSSMSVTISSATAGATIRYTTNGSKPTTTYGTVLSNGGSLTVNRTTCLRACAIKSGMTTSQPFTQTYIFLSDVLKQPANPAGFPAQLRRSAYDDWWVADYAMDPEVVNNSRYSGMIKGAFKSIPTLSLVVNINEMFGTNGALLGAKSGMAKPEIACSAELIYADGRPGFQIDCGLKPHSHTKQKRSLRLLFKTNYGGPAKLDYPFFEDAPVESQSAASSFGKIFLRGGMNQSWAALGNEETAYARDAWSMVTQIAMSGIGPHTTYCHLYINGLYWGLYQPLERPDARFMADYRGGAKGDWDSNNMAGLVSGNATRWNKIWQDLGTRDLSGTSNYNEMAAYLNVRHFADYVIQWWASGGGDWQEWWGKNNYYVANRRNPAEPLLFFAWDMDSCWQIQQPERGRANDGAWVKPQFLTPDEGATNRFYHPENARWYNVAFDASVNQHIARPFRALWKNAEFRMLFADRLYAHCTNGGALTDANAKGRWNALCNYIKDAVVCESARWGDHKKDYDDSSLPVYTRDTHWYGARDKVLTMMTGNAARMLSICRNQIMEGNMLYPSLDPPVFSQYGGSVAAGFKLTLSRVGSAGTIYYRTDGQDPRVSGGGIRSGSSTGTANAVVTLNASATVTARLKNGATWSALAHAKFTVTSGPTVPAAPGGLAAAALSTSQIKLTWADNSGDEDNFKVERRPAGGSWAQIAQLGANATAHTDSGLAAATPYEYRVRASNSAGNSAYSNVAGATTTDNPPAAPSNLAAAALSISQIKLTWADNSNNEVKFELQRSLDGSAWTEIAEPAANATAYTDSGLAAGTQYYYRVNASNAAGDSPNSNVASATTQAAVIPNIAVSTTSITASCTQGQNPPDQTFQVWNGGTGTLQYELVESTDKLSVAPTTGNSTGSANKKTHTVTFTIDNLEPGTYDRTISVEDNGSGAANSPVVINVRMVVEQGVPAAPSGLTATALSASEIRLSWADNSGSELKFEIQRSLDGSAWAEIAEPAADATTYTDSGLAAGTRYYYRIDASNGAGDSPFSNVASATTTLNAPAAPSGLTATALSTSEIRLSWADNSDNEAEFKIRRSLDGADWNVPEPVLLAPNATEYVNTGLQPGTTYHFILRSQNAAGTLGYTDPVLATTLSEAAAPPSDLRADALSAMEIRLTWTDNSDNELGFKIRRGTAPDEQPDELYVDADTTAYVDGGRAPNTTYYYTVKARDNFGGSAYTPVVAATTPRATAGEFIAYNDLAWAEGQRAANISVLTRGEAGLLVDHATGAPVNVRLAISAGGGGPYTTQGADAAAGTDAGALFGGIVDGTGLISYSTEDLVLSLTGLDPTYQYALTLFGNRAGSSYTARTTVVRLEGAESFVNTSSAGARVETDAAADDTTVIANGSNTGQGLVARYAAILCGSDGAVALRIPGWSGTDEAGRYYVNALMVAATERQIPQDKIAKGGTWRYRKGTAEASAPATRWRETGFDDGGWASGNAPFGYGPLSYATVLDMNRVKYASVFLRKTFSVEDPARVSEIRLAIDYDDGFVAWINGREVARVNVQGAPGTFVACNQTCDGYVSGSAAAWAGSLAGSALPALGAENVLAVQVFNNSLASGDALFDAALSVVRTQLSVTEDGDRDALPDAWEADRLAGLSDPADLSDSGDPDADGVSNLEEYIAGTDPQDESDAFAVEVSLVNGAVVVTFDTVAAGGAGYEGRSRHYALEQCVLNASAWSAVPGYEDILGAGQTVTYTPAADAGPYAYRARVWLE